MDCNCKDYTHDIHIENHAHVHKEQEKTSNKNRKLNDVAVELICTSNYEKDEAIQLQLIKAFPFLIY